MLQHFDARDDTDILAGYTFCATMQLRTPLRVLLRHGEKHVGFSEPPVIAREQWEGIWIPVPKSWAELGFDLPELPGGTMASEVGQIPADGGEFLQFLIAVRQLVETDESATARRRKLEIELMKTRWLAFVGPLGGKEKVADKLLPPFLLTIESLVHDTVVQLRTARLTTPRAIGAAPDAKLLAIKGVGPAKLKLIRACCTDVLDPDDEYVDLLVR
ncbi:hypothetical protein [Altererythrobacter sp. TH136]|uniref:hypothetical protein n=1 Tax=Altererythrobacter sp. TH136 TaxID=2067415 RepID=UPI001AEF646D|nr:hypothetical protein [Altererythrobacter sp. TH136]